MAGESYMRRALELAERGRGTVSPNPMVGCVVVRDGEVVGEGWHERAGGPHAEVVALRAAAGRARGADVYVTLEPCAHTGRTPPCTGALLQAGVARVVAAVADPDPRARAGAARLRSAGVDVVVGVCEAEARRQNEVFLHAAATGRPFVTLKSALSLDGRIAAADGTSRWLTGAEGRLRAHRLRAEVDAIVVGSGTVLADDPLLTVRLDGGPPARRPLRVVLDGRRRIGAHHHVVDGAAPTLVVTASGDRDGTWLRGTGAEVACVPAAGGGLDLDAVLALLWERDVRSVLVEGGGTLAGSFLRGGLVQRLLVHVAPLVLGEGGLAAFAGHWVPTLAAAPRFALDGLERAGDDVLLSLTPLEAD